MAGYGMHRRAAATMHGPLQESSSRGDAYVYFPSARRIRISLPAQEVPDGYVDAFDTIASASANDAVSLCLNAAKPWARHADCSQPGWVPAFLLRPLQARMITAVFSDGSTRTYVFESETGRYLPVPGSARDGYGNGIPENVAMASNGGGIDTYGFRGADAARN